MIQLIRGFKDILPGEVERWQQIEKTALSLFKDFGFKEIRIPLMERTELFARSIGEDTDIVEKEMYTFPDRKGDLVTLRPEATASVVRSYIQHKMYAKDPVRKFYTIGPMFRRERPQKGRYRQFYQINVEIFGVTSPLVDVQLIYMLVILFKRLAVEDIQAHINSLGCPACRPDYRKALSKFLVSISDKLCADCRRRSERNPLRVLDCKVPSCQEALIDVP
ncbi:MAG: histidine--tRNA ligase, partial [Desulfobacterales bacterium]